MTWFVLAILLFFAACTGKPPPVVTPDPPSAAAATSPRPAPDAMHVQMAVLNDEGDRLVGALVIFDGQSRPTDAQGYVEFWTEPSPEVRVIHVATDGYEPLEKRIVIPEGDASFVVTLNLVGAVPDSVPEVIDAQKTITVCLIDGNGDPVAHVYVGITNTPESETPMTPAGEWGSTDERGLVTFADVPSTIHEIDVRVKYDTEDGSHIIGEADIGDGDVLVLAVMGRGLRVTPGRLPQ